MNDADQAESYTAGETAQLLGLSLSELEQARCRREIRGEPFRSVWWQLFPRYRYRESEIRAYQCDRVQSSPLVRMANAILVKAMEADVSDIHIEPGRKHLHVRFRINGVLHEEMAVPKPIERPLINHYLWTAQCSPRNHDLPQSGVIQMQWQSRQYDIRLSSVPGYYGTKLVMRLLSSPAPTQWGELGMSAAQAAQTNGLIQPEVPGLILFAAPQGEGLTTNFRCALYNANRPEANIYFLDDIADFPAAGLTRIVLDPENGMTASAAVRAAKRQGASLIVFAEITDRETARVAVETAESGLPVWAGIRVPGFDMNVTPKESARTLWTRFQGFGIAPERLERVLRGAVLSRLIRTLCPDCKEGVPATKRESFEVETHGIAAPENFYRAKGCELCRNTGYRGRTGLFAVYTDSPIGYDRSSFAQRAAALFASGETDAAELRRLKVWSRL